MKKFFVALSLLAASLHGQVISVRTTGAGVLVDPSTFFTANASAIESAIGADGASFSGDVSLVGDYQFSAGNGSVSAPAFTFGNMVTTGWYAVAGPTMRAAVNGTNMFTMTSTAVTTHAATASATYGANTLGGAGVSILPDVNSKLQIGRYSAGAPFSYIKIGTTSSGLKITNSADDNDRFIFHDNGRFQIGVSTVTQSNITNGGAILSTPATNVVDVGSSGTVSFVATSIFLGPTLSASSATTWTDAYTFYVAKLAAGSNATLTSAWAFGAENLHVRGSDEATSAGAGSLVSNGGIYAAKKIIAAGDVIIKTSNPPASASATGVTGTIAWDANYIYVCTATNTWKRTAISTW